MSCFALWHRQASPKKTLLPHEGGRTAHKKWVAATTNLPSPQNDLLVKLLAGLLENKAVLEQEIAWVHDETSAYLKLLRSMQEQCLKRPPENSYDRALYLALRRGLLLVEAQLAWLDEVRGFLDSRQ